VRSDAREAIDHHGIQRFASLARVRCSMSFARDRDVLLDAWRGFSVLLVIGGHAARRFSWPDSPDLLYAFDLLAALGVKFFFAISGYIITTLLVAERRRNGSISMRAFYLRRACRILPALWVFLLFVELMNIIGNVDVPAMSFVAVIGFACNTGITSCSKVLDHTWSLSIEEQFYIVWPAIVLFAGDSRLPRFSVGLVVALLAMAEAGLLIVGWVNNGICFSCIAAGAWYATSARLRKGIDQCSTPVAIAGACVLLFGRPLIPLVFPGQYRLNDIATPFLVCFVMFSTFRYRHSLEILTPVQWLSSIGLVSYGLYLWQQPFLTPRASLPRESFLDWWPLFIGMALLSYFFVERPLLRYGRRVSDRWRQLAPVAPAIAPTRAE
jgi:peptidoglycan/LPS O-acetylase OafA/YrhL